VFPDTDPSLGIEISKVRTSKYPDNLLAPLYKEFEEPEVNFKCLAGREKTRAKWLKKIEKLKIERLKMQAV
jgi:hypothetical protein